MKALSDAVRMAEQVQPGDIPLEENDPTAKANRKGILIRMPQNARKALKRLSLDRELTLQRLMEEAINDLMLKHDRPPIL